MKQYEDIKILLERYFEGETSLQEERSLRDYFASDHVAADFLPYEPIFSFVEQNQNKPISENNFDRPFVASRRKRILIVRSLSAVAACALIVMGIFLSKKDSVVVIPDLGCTGTYIMIEGECYNDPALVFSHAEQTLNDLNIFFENTTTDNK